MPVDVDRDTRTAVNTFNEQNQESGEMQAKASSHSKIVIDKYKSLEADLTAIRARVESDYRHVPLANEHRVVLEDLRYLLGIVNLKTKFWEDAEKELDQIRSAIRRYFEIDPAEDPAAWCRASHELIVLATPDTQDAASASEDSDHG